ncbi:DsrE family protein [Aestuariibacter sp. A3R04]|uniref:DsrE family protein n=1 Tax=Aestuariibacter sp. A3R04 TaxID=2841571 RepID=UPI00352C19D3
MKLVSSGWSVLGLYFLVSLACAQAQDFKAGPVFSEYGRHAEVDGISFSRQHVFKVAFDVSRGSENGELNRRYDTLARFINMHVAHGVKLENIKLALVVHGSATLDMLDNQYFRTRKTGNNDNIPLLKALMDKGVKVVVCGQSAAAQNITRDMLIDGIEMDLSAMTAHARLSNQGYAVNPF